MADRSAWPECLDDIGDAPTSESLIQRLFAAAAPYGLTMGASGVVVGRNAVSRNRFHFAIWPEGVLKRYFDENLMADDPAPRWARATGLPVAWTEILARLAPADPGRRLFTMVGEFGITEGIAVPMRAADGALGLISLGGARGPLSPSEKRQLIAIASTAFRRAEELDPSVVPADAAPVLTEREMGLLPFLVHGHSDKQIALLMGIAEATVRFHLKNLRQKLDATSRTHLAAKAVALGFVTI